jgi:hypothetical protein
LDLLQAQGKGTKRDGGQEIEKDGEQASEWENESFPITTSPGKSWMDSCELFAILI